MADNRRAYGLAKRYGIDTKGMTPEEVWEALKKKGITANNAYDSRDDFKQIVDRATGKVLSTVTVPSAVKFNRLNTKNHIRHAKELGYKNQAEYEKAAADFFSSTRGKLYIDLRLKKFYRYEEKTRLLVVVDGDGGICTFHRVENKNAFIRKIKQEGLYEIE